MDETPRIPRNISGSIRQVTTVPGSRGVIQNVSGTLGAFTAGDVINGKVLSQERGGLTQVLTEQGTLTFDSRLPLPKGGDLLLKITTQGDHFQARILSVEGKPLPEFIQQQGILPGQEAAQGNGLAGLASVQDDVRIRTPNTEGEEELQNSSGQQQGRERQNNQTSVQQASSGNKGIQDEMRIQAFSLSLREGGTVKAILLAPQEYAVNQLAARGENFLSRTIFLEPSLPLLSSGYPAPPPPVSSSPVSEALGQTGTVFTLKIVTLELPPAPLTAPSASFAPPTGGETGQSYGRYANPLPSTFSSAYASQTTLSPEPPSEDWVVSLPLKVYASGRVVVTAAAIGQDAQGGTTLSSALGTFRLEVPVPLGTKLELEITSLKLPVTYAEEAPSSSFSTARSVALPAISPLKRQWPALASLLGVASPYTQVSTQTSPELLSALREMIPSPGQEFGNQIARFITTLQNGDLGIWLGAALLKHLKGSEDTAEAGHQLKRDVEMMHLLANRTSSPAGNDWKMFLFPVLVDEELYQARFFVRDHHGNEEGEGKNSRNKKPGNRFVVEVSMEELGDIQLDGLVYHPEEGTKMDLVIRSQTPLPETLRNDIRSLLAATAEVGGLKGTVGFQVITRHFPVQPLEELRASLSEQGADDSWIV